MRGKIMKKLLFVLVILMVPVMASEIVQLDKENFKGWKQAGPGKFNIENGVATSEGGMGLFWYSLKKFENVTYDLEFKMGDPSHNSGIFVLFDDPGDDPMAAVKSGYEVQINNDKPSKHSTGAIYDLKPSVKVPLKAGWNKYRITCVDGWIVIKLNDEVINVFQGSKGHEGYFGVQNHDPNSVVSFRNIKAEVHTSLEDIFTPEEKVQIRKVLNPKERQHNVMDIGNHITACVEVLKAKNYAYKGLTVYLGHELNPYTITYDTDLLRVASVNQNKVGLIGTLYDGTHDSSLKQNKDFMVTSRPLPGWSLTNEFKDPRETQFGPIPAEMAKFKGIYRHGSRVAVKFTVGNTEAIESPRLEKHGDLYAVARSLKIGPRDHQLKMSVGDFESTVKIEGNLATLTDPADGKKISIAVVGENLILKQDKGRLFVNVPSGDKPFKFKVVMARADKFLQKNSLNLGIEDVSGLLKPSKALYPEEIIVPGNISSSSKPYVVDDIPVPFNNPWNVYMRTAAFDFFKDGKTAAVSTWNGDVWLVKNIEGDFKNISWKRICTGLYEPLGLKIVDEKIYVTCRDMVARLHDLNGDEAIDYIENFNNDVHATANHHEYCFDLKTDKNGDFYFAKAAPVNRGGRGFQTITRHSGTVLKLSKDGSKLEVYSTGMRAPNGIGVSPDGQVTAGDNEGTWVPHCKLHWLQKGSFQGVKPVAHEGQKTAEFNKPLCWFPMEVDNSGGDQIWVTDDRWGPFKGELLHLSYGTSSIYKVMKETVDGQVQGGVFRIPVQLGSSAMRSRFNKADGQLYVIGFKGWQTNAAKEAAFQRVRYTGKKVNMPSEMHVKKDGVVLKFTTELDKELAEDPTSYRVQWWNYLWGPQYGSGEFSVYNPDKNALESGLKKESKSHRKRDNVKVHSARLLPDKKSVFIKMDMHEVMQMHIKVDLETTDGDELIYDIYNTVNKVPN